ncbi:CobT, cobaltochelatase, CobT subunit [uncultured Caudovirales phage]|uniref:CobT, cobaltochelatase, CobT subunit n=1 Tax=uncultured Caudovirales phage TaxID=2100421 RepID=A0A6J7WQU9_9CAUD|nr:CobT, cobaltochelatase, CobT subunit [uncultured Caudovirales phage]
MIRRDITRSEFEAATRSVAQNLSKSGTNIEVVFHGTGAYTNGSTIVLPAGDSLEIMTAKDQGVIAGYVDHEAAHILYTDMHAYDGDDSGYKGNKWFHEFVNACEDMRIEPQMMRNWDGTRANLDDVSRAVNSRTLQDMLDCDPSAFESESEWLPVAVTWEGRKRMGLATDLSDAMLRLLPKSTRDKAIEVMNEVQTLSDGKAGTKEVIELAKKWMGKVEFTKRLKEEEVKREATKGDSDEDGTGPRFESEDKAEEAKAEAKDDDAEVGVESEAAGETEGCESGDEPSEEFDDPSVRSASVKPSELVGTGVMAGYRNVMSEPVFHHRTIGPTMMYELRRYGGAHLSDVSQQDTMNHTRGEMAYQHDLDMMRGNVATMRTKLRRALMAKKDRVWESGHTRGRFDTRRIVPALRGAEDVYTLRREGADIDTAVTLVVDCSGSMSGEKIDLARKTVVAMASALDGTGVSFEVVGFTNLRTAKSKAEIEVIEDAMRGRKAKADSTYGAYDRVHIYEFKRFDEPMRDARRAIGNMSNMWLMENNDADSLLAILPRIKKRHEPRKIMMVLSDGAPYCETYGRDHDCLRDRMKPTLDVIAKAGVDLIGIGIMDGSVRHYYPKWEVVKKASDLSGTVVDNIAKMLLGDKFMADNGRLERAAS